MGSFPFLQLPRELRDRIYEYALESEVEPPVSPEDPTISNRWELDTEPNFKTGIILEKKPLADVTCRGLLYSNVQVMDEVRNALSRNGVTCKLDCMFQNWKVWATWTSLPPSLERLRIVEVDFRLFSCNCKQWRGIGGGGTIIR